MSQSRKHSAIETLTSIGIGFIVSLVITAIVLPLYGHDVTAAQNIQMTAIFTVASIVRGYWVRRLFNWWGSRHGE